MHLQDQPANDHPSFIDKHDLWTDDQKRRADELKLFLEKDKLQFVRIAWADPHGASRAKAVTVPAFLAALTSGYNINVATTTLNSANARTFSSFTRGGGMGLPEMTGSPNLTIVPDPSTFRVLPSGRPASAGSLPTSISIPACRSISRRGICCASSSPAWRARLEAGRRARGRVVPDARRAGAARRRQYRRARNARLPGAGPRRSSPAIRTIPNPTWI